MPVVIGALGLIKTGLGKYTVVEKIPRKINIEELPKISLLCTAHILQKVLYQLNEDSLPPPKLLPRKLGTSWSPGQ